MEVNLANRPNRTSYVGPGHLPAAYTQGQAREPSLTRDPSTKVIKAGLPSKDQKIL